MADDRDDGSGSRSDAPRRGSGAPGRGGKVDAPKPNDASKQKPSERGRVARNNDNSLKVALVRLPIGHITALPQETTYFRLWIPCDGGGTLKLRTSNPRTSVQLQRPLKHPLYGEDPVVIHEVKVGEFGEYFVRAIGSVGDQITCEFEQTAIARDGRGEMDPPLLPWNFWYWPTARGDNNKYHTMAGSVMEKYARAFGKDPDKCRETELSDHSTDEVDTDIGYDWQGHCHNASPASALFELPQQGSHGGETFTDKELQYLAAEYYGNFGQSAKVWEFHLGGKPLGNSRWDVLAYLKPGTPKTIDSLIQGLQTEYTQSVRSTIETWFQSKFGGKEDAFAKQVNQWMGQSAAEFYQKLLELMAVAKHPLESNMRGYRVTDRADAVWNQVYFWYSAYYIENWETHDERDIVISCELHANIDDYGATHEPAVVVSPKELGWIGSNFLGFKHLWRLVFDDAGKVATTDARNEWRSVQNSSKGELFAPTNLLILGKPLETMPPYPTEPERRRIWGNRYVGNDLVKAGLLKVRKRYR